MQNVKETRATIPELLLTTRPDSISPLPLNDTIMPEFHSRRIPMNFMEHSEPLPPFNDLSADED